MFAFCQLVILEDRNITNTTMDRIMLYTSHCLGLVNVLFIVPLIGFHQASLMKLSAIIFLQYNYLLFILDQKSQNVGQECSSPV